jgi:hypothetical protein
VNSRIVGLSTFPVGWAFWIVCLQLPVATLRRRAVALEALRGWGLEGGNDDLASDGNLASDGKFQNV